MKIKLPPSSQNWISLIGATIALISLFMIAFLFAISIFLGEGGLYLGIVIFILLPAVLVAGLFLIPIGMYLRIRKERKHGKIEQLGWPRIDLNDKRHRNAFFIFSIGTTIFLFLSALGSYEAFHFTESTRFCGTLCHYIMVPEHTAYQNSPHAKVLCASCHVGPGAGWYVRSKLSGAYQVYATLTNKYPKPIPTPIKNLRPAREVCEQCHWPQKFYAHKLRLETHYLNDEENTRWDIRLIMKIGAEHSALGLQEGIHWHINPNVRIEYIASDERNEELPWVRYINLETGDTTVYVDQDNPIAEEDISTHQIKTMECTDCHNRPSHDYRAPAIFINQAITAGEIPKSLPEIKSVAMGILGEEFTTTDSALIAIREYIENYYQENYSETVQEQAQLIEQAITGVQNAFSKNIFPEMRVRWDAYPNNIGHQEFKGCFRCHNNNHTSKQGAVIRKDCNLCHYINAQGKFGEMEVAQVGENLEFKHPVDIDQAWKESLCIDCHTGLNP
jgi:hypothetical protein